MATKPYYERVIDVLKPYVTPEVYNRARKNARSYAGGKAVPRAKRYDHVATLLELAKITPDRLKDEDDETLDKLHKNVHDLHSQAVAEKRSPAPFIAAHATLTKAMRKRNIDYSGGKRDKLDQPEETPASAA